MSRSGKQLEWVIGGGLVAAAAVVGARHFWRTIFPHNLHLRPCAGPWNVGAVRLAHFTAASPTTSGAAVGAGESLPPVAIFFPCLPQKDSSASWVPHGDGRYVEGIARYIGLPQWLFSFLKTHSLGVAEFEVPLEYSSSDSFEANREVDLGHPEADDNRRSPLKRPLPLNAAAWDGRVIVFSHGLAGHQAAFSTLCMDIASGGPIVIAVDHQDGSASFTKGLADANLPERNCPDPTSPLASLLKSKEGFYVKPGQESRAVFGPEDMDYRSEQLRFRSLEISRVLQTALASDSGRGLLHLFFDKFEIDKAAMIFKAFGERGVVTATKPLRFHLVGHSFGGAAVVHSVTGATRPQAKKVGSPGIPIGSVVAMDPWCEPLRVQTTFQGAPPAASPDGLKPDSLPPLMILDSEHWERWTSNKKEEEILMDYWNAVAAAAAAGQAKGSAAAVSSDLDIPDVCRETLVGTDHYSASDMGLFFPKTKRKPYLLPQSEHREAIRHWASRILDFTLAAGARPPVPGN
jgi:hypothetical protein